MNNEIRVTSGRYRGRVLRSPESVGTHPMGAREKLALFNMINVENTEVLDAFAGSGALGIEALSRGASRVVFVESNARVAQTVVENLIILGIDYVIVGGRGEGKFWQAQAGTGRFGREDELTTVIARKVEQIVTDQKFQEKFDVILADPPYDKFAESGYEGLGKLLRKDGILGLSAPAKVAEIEIPGLTRISQHKYAGARIWIFRKI